jgi:hypothetical protein
MERSQQTAMTHKQQDPGSRLGRVILFGSGEIAPSGRNVHASIFEVLSEPVQVAILETPAGFQPNTDVVAQEVADFMHHHLQNFHPQVTIVPARKRGTAFSPDDPAIVEPILEANYVFLGPGSPTYAVRQLRDTLAWRYIVAAQRRGAAISLASAATVAAGKYTLPVYEIYKAGHELHWIEGLDFFKDYGLELAIVPHWNNTDGGAKLDTSCCYMGRERMRQLEGMLPADVTRVGIDEHTALVLDFSAGVATLHGKGSVQIRHGTTEAVFETGAEFPLTELGDFRVPAPDDAGLPPSTVAMLEPEAPTLPANVRTLVEERVQARAAEDWEQADALRERIADLGYEIQDAPDGPRWRPQDESTEWRRVAGSPRSSSEMAAGQEESCTNR